MSRDGYSSEYRVFRRSFLRAALPGEYGLSGCQQPVRISVGNLGHLVTAARWDADGEGADLRRPRAEPHEGLARPEPFQGLRPALEGLPDAEEHRVGALDLVGVLDLVLHEVRVEVSEARRGPLRVL